MSRNEYIRPSVRYININAEVLLCSSTYQVNVSHDEGAWNADANKESDFASIWDSDLWSENE